MTFILRAPAIRPHFLGPIGGLKIEGPLYIKCCIVFFSNSYFYCVDIGLDFTSSYLYRLSIQVQYYPTHKWINLSQGKVSTEHVIHAIVIQQVLVQVQDVLIEGVTLPDLQVGGPSSLPYILVVNLVTGT